jgi:hypothetical protein
MEMENKMKTRDELIKNFGTAGLPASSGDPNINDTTGARASFPSGEPSTLPSLFAGEYSAPPSNLPEQVSQATIASENRERWHNIGPGDSNAPTLAGTTVEESDNEV